MLVKVNGYADGFAVVLFWLWYRMILVLSTLSKLQWISCDGWGNLISVNLQVIPSMFLMLVGDLGFFFFPFPFFCFQLAYLASEKMLSKILISLSSMEQWWDVLSLLLQLTLCGMFGEDGEGCCGVSGGYEKVMTGILVLPWISLFLPFVVWCSGIYEKLVAGILVLSRGKVFFFF